MTITRKTTAYTALFLACLVCACSLIPRGKAYKVETEALPPIPTDTQQPLSIEETHPAVTLPSPTITAPQSPPQVEGDEVAVESASGAGLVDRLCPELSLPRGLFNLQEISQNSKNEEATEYSLYQVRELGVEEEPPDFCTLFLAPPPLGKIQFVGESLFWQSYDYMMEQVIVWQYDPTDTLTDEIDPYHIPLQFTTMDLPSSFMGLTSFIVSDDGNRIVWAKTEPNLNNEEYFYYQEIYASDLYGSSVDPIWANAVPEIDAPRIIRLHAYSGISDMVYFSEEPVGLGTQWPNPAGQFSNLYSVPTWGEMPITHYECDNHWCISDFSEEHDLVAVIIENSLQLLEMSGDLIVDISPADDFNVLRQALIGPAGDIVFLAIEYDYSTGETSRVALFHLLPPYNEAATLVVEDSTMRNIYGWLSDNTVLTDSSLDPDPSNSNDTFMIIDLTNMTVTHREKEEYPFEFILP